MISERYNSAIASDLGTFFVRCFISPIIVLEHSEQEAFVYYRQINLPNAVLICVTSWNTHLNMSYCSFGFIESTTVWEGRN